MKLNGRVAIVTGGAKGIGRGIAELFGEEGAHVTIVGREKAAVDSAGQALADKGIRVVALSGDVSRNTDVRRVVDATLDRFGRIDILVNNAGVNPNRGRTVSQTEESDWDFAMAVNLRGVFLCVKAVLPTMRVQRGGWIINIASIGGRLTPDGKNAAYRTSKFGVRGFTWTLAKDVRDDNIAVSAILPGTTRSAMIANEVGDTSGWLEPRDIAEAALFLATRDPKVVIPEMTVAPRFTIGGLMCPYS